MDTLTELVDRELAACGFPVETSGSGVQKEAYNPFMTTDRQRVESGADKPTTTLAANGLAQAASNEDTRAHNQRLEPEVTQMFRGNPVKAAAAAARSMNSRALLEKAAKERASAACGLRGPTECLQVFTGSDFINQIKQASFRDAVLRMLPEDVVLPFVQRLKGTPLLAAQTATDLENYLVGKGLRDAAERMDVSKARSLFESLGGAPSIDPGELAALQIKARAYDAAPSPIEQYLAGLRTGGLGGMALGAGGVLGLQHRRDDA